MSSTATLRKHSQQANASRVGEIKSLPYKPSSVSLSEIQKAVATVIKQRRAAQAAK